MHELRVLSFGAHLVRYGFGLQLQERLAELRKARAVCDTLVLLQHAPVYTIGKRGKLSHFKLSIEELQSQGVDVHSVPRGGEVTYHGPGQLVAYPVLGLRELGRGARTLVEGLEDTLVETAAAYGVQARGRVPGATGVWVDDRKLAAIGVKISGGVCTHGIALNVCTDLAAYDKIVPCGIPDKRVTSLLHEVQGTRGRVALSCHTPLVQGPASALDDPAAWGRLAQELAVGGSCWVRQATVSDPWAAQDASTRAASTQRLHLPHHTADAAMRHVSAVFLDRFCTVFGHLQPRHIELLV